MILLIKKDTVPNVRNQIVLKVNSLNQMWGKETVPGKSLNEIGRYDFAPIFINCECLWLAKQKNPLSFNCEEISSHHQ